MSLRIHIFLPTLSHSLGQREGAGDCPFSVPNTCDATVDILALSFIIVRTSLRVGKEKVFGSSDLGRCGWGSTGRGFSAVHSHKTANDMKARVGLQ